ncbi:MAG: hypothetical protein ACRC75_12360 [Olsenella sp.]
MSESITKELREYAAEHSYWRRGTEYVTMNDILPIADRIDERFDRELRAKQEEVDGLKADNAKPQAKLDASMPLPVDADGVPWTCADVDKSFSLTDGDKTTEWTVRDIAYAWPREGWWIVDQYDTHYPAGRCRHVVHWPPETIEDVRKSCDNTVSYLASVSGMGWHDVETFSKDVHEQLDRAYSCGKRDGAGIEASRLHHVAPEPSEPTDSQERIDADVEKSACEYFGRPGLKSCDGCPAYNGDKRISCMTKQKLDLLRRQRELDGAGERA